MDFSNQFSKVNLASKVIRKKYTKDLDKRKNIYISRANKSIFDKAQSNQSIIIRTYQEKRLASQKNRVLCQMTQMSLTVS